MPTDKLQTLKDSIISGNIPQLVLAAISYALDLRSSDIHIEPISNTVRIRYRVDGVLRMIVEYPSNIHPAVVSRIKIMSNLKIDEQRLPQDGRCEVTTQDNRDMDLRVSTFPGVYGEKIVMRIQDKSRKIPALLELGLEGHALELIQQALDIPNGIILTTGPTGSGKTTTLYSMLTVLNTDEVNILTIEDPVEISIDGLNQSQVHTDINYTFASGLRTALRQDPDIIMVGEIRDRDSMDIAIEASLTGHLVLSTIHTNSAIDTLIRINNLGVPGFLTTATVDTIISQRLVRKLCPHCRELYAPDEKTLAMAKGSFSKLPPATNVDPVLLEKMQFYKPKGCEQCDNIGYHGRIGVYEILKMSDPLRRLILDKASSMDLETTAMQEGMITLEQMGLLKALHGETTLEEVYLIARHKT